MPPSSPRATITDVAKAAGVALGTVSRVFNHHADVNTEIRDRVMNTARKLG
jgi:DNA-binding LacI/PurR family transcriptional regulator